MVKPFDFEELLVRLQALTRRTMSNKSTTKIIFGSYEMDVEAGTVMLGKEHIHLSTLEFNVLKYLLQKQGHIIPKEELYEKVWGEYDVFKMGKTVDVYIGYLRKKLGVEVIKTVKGRGYMVG
jgi:two-component system, OmpR family, response regulator